MNNSPSNIFNSLLLLKRYHQNSLAVLAATGMNGFSKVHQNELHNPKGTNISISVYGLSRNYNSSMRNSEN